MPKVTFSHANKSADAAEGDWLYDVVEGCEDGIPFSCKAGACGTCATEVKEGRENLGEQTAREVRTLEAQGLDPLAYRLPCLCGVHGDVVFGTPHAAAENATSLSVHDVVVETYRPLNATVGEVRFFVESPAFAFLPGQYMIFHIPHPGHAVRRSYSISTPPSDKHHFEVSVRSVAGGHGSNYIHRLRPGNRLKVEGPYGDLVLQEKSSRRALMIATGTGVSPIKSMLLHLLDTRSTREVHLLFGVRHEADLFYTDLYRGLASRYPQFRYDVTLSAPNPETPAGRQGRVTQVLEETVRAGDAENTEVYLCGGQRMIEDCKARLKEKGFPEQSLHHENFF